MRIDFPSGMQICINSAYLDGEINGLMDTCWPEVMGHFVSDMTELYTELLKYTIISKRYRTERHLVV